jgi:hypothetical protein
MQMDRATVLERCIKCPHLKSPRMNPAAKNPKIPTYCGIALNSADFDFLGMMYDGKIHFSDTVSITERGGKETREVDNRNFEVPHDCPYLLDFLMLKDKSKCP